MNNTTNNYNNHKKKEKKLFRDEMRVKMDKF